jgi:hypothetical protein
MPLLVAWPPYPSRRVFQELLWSTRFTRRTNRDKQPAKTLGLSRGRMQGRATFSQSSTGKPDLRSVKVLFAPQNPPCSQGGRKAAPQMLTRLVRATGLLHRAGFNLPLRLLPREPLHVTRRGWREASVWAALSRGL